MIENMNELLLPFVVAGIAVTYGCWRLLIRPYLENKKPFNNLPMPSENHWLLGHMDKLYGDLDTTQKKLAVDYADEYGRTGYWVGPRKYVAVTRYQDARAVLNAESWRDGNPISKRMLGALMPNSILVLNGQKWKHNRNAINKSFTPAGLDASAEAMAEVTETIGNTLRERISAEGPYEGEIEPLMKMITFDVFGKATFSKDFGCTKSLKANEFAAAFDNISTKATFEESKNTIGYVEAMIEERQAEGTEKKNDLLSHIIDASNKNGKKNDGSSKDNNSEILRDVVATVLFAGYDTTSITLTYALHMLSQHPEIVDKCLEEIASVKSLKTDYDDLVYCRAVVTETLRLFPPAAQTMRTLQKPVKLPENGFFIPAGTTVMVPIWSVHHDERNFARPMEFLPERWVQQEAGEDGVTMHWAERDPNANTTNNDSSPVPAANPKALFAFSGGGRNCPGMKFAWQEAVIVLAGLIRDFEFETRPGYELKVERTGFIQHPEDHMPMKITQRE